MYVYGFLLILLILERIFPRKNYPFFRKGFFEDMFYFFFLAYLLPYIFDLGHLEALLQLQVFHLKFSLPLVWSFILALIINDFFRYWVHRSFHEFDFLWKFHKLHHSSNQLTAVSAFRNNVVEDVFLIIFASIPLFVLGFDKTVIEIISSLYIFQGILTHANISLNWGVFEKVFCTPQFHHTHHEAGLKRRTGNNYGVMFPIWDFLFSTHSVGEDQGQYGFSQQDPFPQNLFLRLIHPLDEYLLFILKKLR